MEALHRREGHIEHTRQRRPLVESYRPSVETDLGLATRDLLCHSFMQPSKTSTLKLDLAVHKVRGTRVTFMWHSDVS